MDNNLIENEDTKKILRIFNVIAPEYKDITEDMKYDYLEIALPLVSQKQFKSKYHQSVALMMAHMMMLNGIQVAEDGSQDTVQAAQMDFRISSFSEGDSQISFNAPNAQNGAESSLYLTKYGLQFLFIKKHTVVPLTVFNPWG